MDNVFVKRKIIPGETLVMHAKLIGLVEVLLGSVSSFVNGEPAVSFDVTAVVLGELDKFKPSLEG